MSYECRSRQSVTTMNGLTNKESFNAELHSGSPH
jgi:hypothetical protein